jgi:hypothetical protein
MLSHKFKFIFVHCPKTGGSSIRETIVPHDPEAKDCDVGPEHKSSKEYKAEYPDLFDLYWKFGFVRNPWDMVISLYLYHVEIVKQEIPDLQDYLHGDLTLKYDVFLHPTEMFFNDENGNELMDDIFKFEELHDSWDIITKKTGIPARLEMQMHKTSHEHYSNFYKDKEYIDNVANMFAWTIDRFKYKFS